MRKYKYLIVTACLALALCGCGANEENADATAENSSETAATIEENGDNAIDLSALPEGATLVSDESLLDDEVIIEKYNLRNLSESELDQLINSLDPNDYVRLRIVTMRHDGTISGAQQYWGPETPTEYSTYTENYDYGQYLKDYYNYNPWDGDLDDLWALISTAKNINERMSIISAVNKYFRYNFDWDGYLAANSPKQRYTDAELQDMMSSVEKINGISDTELSNMYQDQMMEIYNYAMSFYGEEVANSFIDRWSMDNYMTIFDKLTADTEETNEVAEETHYKFVTDKDFSVAGYLEESIAFQLEHCSGFTTTNKEYLANAWADWYCHHFLPIGEYKAGEAIEGKSYNPDNKIGNIDRGVPDDTEYSQEEFYERVKELELEDINVFRRSMGNYYDGTELKPYLGADKWTDAFADQRAYERMYGGKDWVHERPKNKMNADGYSWTIYSDAFMNRGVIISHPAFWPDGYKKYVRGENLAHGIIIKKADFKYNEYYAKQVADYAFFGLWSSFGHSGAMISPEFTHVAVGVYENKSMPEVHFQVVHIFYSLDSEEGLPIDDGDYSVYKYEEWGIK